MIGPVLIIFIAFFGFCLAVYLFHKKRRKQEHFICPFRGNCTDVIQSDYSKFLGVPVEILGLLYYALIAVGYGFVIADSIFEWFDVFLLIASAFAFLFSLYLTSIQVFALKKFCTWCLLSASFCLAIFAISLGGSLEIVIPFFIQYRALIGAVHLLTIGIGTGIVTTTTVFFYQFLRDGRLSAEESKVLSTLFELGWASLGLLLTLVGALYVSGAEWFVHSSIFLLESVATLVVVLGTGYLTLQVMPQLERISSGEEHIHESGELLLARKRIFMLGPVSLVSWYAVFLLSILPNRVFITTSYLLIGYLLLLLFAMACGMVMYRRILLTSH